VTRQKRLGRGLAALLGGPMDEMGNEIPQHELHTQPSHGPRLATIEEGPEEEPAGEPMAPPATLSGLPKLPIGLIDRNPFQPRQEFDPAELASLAESLVSHDLLQPIVVRLKGERYELISGERRLRAAAQAGWDTIPAQIREADDRLVAELAIVENMQRQDLNALEKAISFQRYLEQHKATQGELAERIKVDRSTIANLVRLLELPEEVKNAIHAGELTAGHARALLPLGDEPIQTEFARRIQKEGWSVRATEQAVQEFINSEDGSQVPAAAKKRKTASPQIAALEEDLRLALGTKIEIKQGTKGGKIIVHFKNADEFDRLNDLMLGDYTAQQRAA